MTSASLRPITPNHLPREYLNAGENVLFDTRPHIMAVVGLGLVAWFILGSIIFLGIAASIPFTRLFFGIIWLLLVLLPLVLRILQWSRMFYSLTDQRVLVGSGVVGRNFKAYQLVRIGGMLDVSTYRITSVTFNQGFTGRIFGFGDITFGTNQGGIMWKGAKNPVEVRRLVEETAAKLQESKGGEITYTEEVIKKVADIKTEESFGLVAPTKPGVSIDAGSGPIGASSRPSLSSVKYCPNCGKQNSGEARFCNYCGKSMPAPS